MQTKQCTTCHTEKSITEFSKQKTGKYGVTSQCKICNTERNKQFYKENSDHIAERCKKYRQNNKEPIAEWHKLHYQDNKEIYAGRGKKYRENNKEQINERGNKYYEENKQAIAERMKQYHQTPKGKAVLKAARHNRRAQKSNNGGKHTSAEILALFNQQSGICPYCKSKLSKTGSNKYHSDHVMPLSKGGSNDISNIQLLCPKCNHKKGAKLPEKFAQENGVLL